MSASRRVVSVTPIRRNSDTPTRSLLASFREGSDNVRPSEYATRLVKTFSQSTFFWIDPGYQESWNSYRRLRRIVFCLFAAAVLEIRFLFFVPAILTGITFFVYFLLALWMANWKCPRCGEPFFRGAFMRSLFGGKCFHCSLPKWSISETGDLIARPRFPFGWRETIRTPTSLAVPTSPKE